MSRVIDLDDPLVYDKRFLDWLQDHGIKPADTFKVEVEDGWMVVHQLRINRETGLAAFREPFNVRLRRPVPGPV